MPVRKRTLGSSAIEYALPATILLVASTLLWNILDINSHLARFYATASGQRNNVQANGIFKAEKLGENASGKIQNGAESFTNYAEVFNGNGATIKIKYTEDGLYNGPVDRGAAAQTGGSNGEVLYALTGSASLKQFLEKANESDENAEYVSRVLNAANTTFYVGLIKDGLATGKTVDTGYLSRYTQALIAQNVSTQTYAVTHPTETNRFGGLAGASAINAYVDESVEGSREVRDMADEVGVKNDKFKDIAKEKAKYDKNESTPGQLQAINSGYTSVQNESEALKQFKETSDPNNQALTAKWWELYPN